MLPLTEQPPHKVAGLGIARTFQNIELFEHASVLHNLLIGRHTRRETGLWADMFFTRKVRTAEVRAREKAEQVIDFLDLQHYRDTMVAGLPYGVRKVVELARALCTEPQLLLLDEPFAALDALTRIRMHDLVNELVLRHRPAALLVTHDVDEAILLSDRILVLANGTIDLDVTVDIEGPRLRTDPRFVALKERLLDQLGVLRTFVKEGHQPCWGSASSWGDDELGYNDFAVNIHGHGWHVERTRFDAMLARQAARRGVTVYRGWRLRDATPNAKGGYQVALRDDEQRERLVSARIVVDASGMSGAFAPSVGARRIYDDRLVSVAGIFDLKPEAAIDQRTWLEAAPYGWWYCARLNEHQAIVSVTTDSTTARQRLLASVGAWFMHLAQTLHVGARLHGSSLTADGLRPWAAPSYRLEPCAGADWLAVGDSALSYDPITAQGIHKALDMGILAAQAIAARLGGDARDFDEYQRAVSQRHAAYLDLRRRLYAREQRFADEPFWKARLQQTPTTLRPPAPAFGISRTQRLR